MEKLPSVLFVCMGNICRSPAAEIIWTTKTTKFVSDEIDSAGTIAYHNGEAPDSRIQRALINVGYKPFGRSRKFNVSDLDRFDLIFAMDEQNLLDISSTAESAGKSSDHCHLFLEYAGIGKRDIPDPYYGGDKGFTNVIKLIEAGCDEILKKIELKY